MILVNYPLYNMKYEIKREIRNYYFFRLEHGFPGLKIVVGVPAFGRAWKMTEDSAISGVPPFITDGPAPEGPYTKHEGLLSYPEVCTKINSPVSAKGSDKRLRKIGDPSKRYGK